MTALLLLAACTAGEPVEPLPGPASLRVTVDQAGGTYRFAGGNVTVPADAVRRPTVMHVHPAQRIRTTPALRPAGPAVHIDLCGVQPSRPLRVTLAAPRTPDGTNPDAVLVNTAPGVAAGRSATNAAKTPGRTIAGTILTGRCDPARKTVTFPAAHLSSFQTVWFDALVATQDVRDFIAQDLLKVRTARPACASQPTPMSADGTVVRFAPAAWLDAADPDIWACLTRTAQGVTEVRLTNNRPYGFAFPLPDGVRADLEPHNLEGARPASCTTR